MRTVCWSLVSGLHKLETRTDKWSYITDQPTVEATEIPTGLNPTSYSGHNLKDLDVSLGSLWRHQWRTLKHLRMSNSLHHQRVSQECKSRSRETFILANKQGWLSCLCPWDTSSNAGLLLGSDRDRRPLSVCVSSHWLKLPRGVWNEPLIPDVSEGRQPSPRLVMSVPVQEFGSSHKLRGVAVSSSCSAWKMLHF